MPPARPKTKRASKTAASKRKPCQFCADKAIDVSYRDVNRLTQIRFRTRQDRSAPHLRQLRQASAHADRRDQARSRHRIPPLRFGVNVVKVILLGDVKSLGKKGDVVDVAEGYARNYLLPRNLASEASKGALAALGSQKKAAERRDAQTLAEAKTLAQLIQNAKLAVKAKAGGNGKLFGAVTNADVADAIPTTLVGRGRQAQNRDQEPDQGAWLVPGRNQASQERRRQSHGRCRRSLSTRASWPEARINRTCRAFGVSSASKTN